MKVSAAHVLRSILRLACCCVGLGLFMIGMQVPFALILIAAGVVWNRFRRVAGSSWSHGTARFASMGDLIRSRMLGQDGLILGTTGSMPRASFWEGLSALCFSASAEGAVHQFLSAIGGSRLVNDRMIRLTHFTHLATFAPTGRGKGVSVLIPNLLSYHHSCVVTDPKGELFLETALHRIKVFKHLIFNLDPFEICKLGTFTFNPLDCIDDKGEDFLHQCRDIANMMIIRSGTEPDPHWNDSAELVLTAFIAFVCACETDPKQRNLSGVRALVSSRQGYLKAIEIMQQVESHGGVIQRLGEQLTWFIERELGSVMTTLQRQTMWLDEPMIARNLSSSSFNPMALRTGRATVYLNLPHDKLETLAPLMRLWIGVILRTITRGQPSERNPVLFFLDEAAHLGKIRVLEGAITLMRGMGIRLWFFYQSLHQLQDCFGEKAKTIIDNIDTQQYFGTKSYEVADELSKRIGDTTISVASRGENDGRTRQTGGTSGPGQPSGSVSSGRNTNYSDTGRRLLKPEELLTLPQNVALVFHGNMPVIAARLRPYFNDPAFRNGGTGNQPGLGQNAMQQAVAVLLASLVFAAVVVSLCPFNPWPYRRPASIQPWPVSSGPDSSAEFKSYFPAEWQNAEWRFPEE